MPDFAAWRNAERVRVRALDVWRRIQDAPTAITIRRGGGGGGETLAAQTVRIEMGSGAREDRDLRRGLNVLPGVQGAVVFGVRGHPTVSDTDIRRGDRFVVGAAEFEVTGVVEAAGEVQATCEART